MTEETKIPEQYKDQDVRTLRDWLKVPSVAKNRDYIALACTERQDMEPSLAFSALADKVALDGLIEEGKALYEAIVSDPKNGITHKHWAPIIRTRRLRVKTWRR